jgi:hypothetical protein
MAREVPGRTQEVIVTAEVGSATSRNAPGHRHIVKIHQSRSAWWSPEASANDLPAVLPSNWPVCRGRLARTLAHRATGWVAYLYESTSKAEEVNVQQDSPTTVGRYAASDR